MEACQRGAPGSSDQEEQEKLIKKTAVKETIMNVRFILI